MKARYCEQCDILREQHRRLGQLAKEAQKTGKFVLNRIYFEWATEIYERHGEHFRDHLKRLELR